MRLWRAQQALTRVMIKTVATPGPSRALLACEVQELRHTIHEKFAKLEGRPAMCYIAWRHFCLGPCKLFMHRLFAVPKDRHQHQSGREVRGPIFRWFFDPWTPSGLVLVYILGSRIVTLDCLVESSKAYPCPRGLAGPEIDDFWGLNATLLP